MVASGAVVGLTDVDAVTVSMARMVREGVTPVRGAQAIAVACLANTLLKAGLVVVLGQGAFRRTGLAGLAVISAAGAVALWTWS